MPPEEPAGEALEGKVPCVPVKGRTPGSFLSGRFAALACGAVDFETSFEGAVLVGTRVWGFKGAPAFVLGFGYVGGRCGRCGFPVAYNLLSRYCAPLREDVGWAP